MRRAGGQGSRRACRFSASLPCLQAAGHMHQALFRAWLSCPQCRPRQSALLLWAGQGSRQDSSRALQVTAEGKV